MKNQQGIQYRIVLIVTFSMGYIVGMTSKNWWGLLIAVVISIVVSFFIGFFTKLYQIYGPNKLSGMSRQQRRALIRLADKNDN